MEKCSTLPRSLGSESRRRGKVLVLLDGHDWLLFKCKKKITHNNHIKLAQINLRVASLKRNSARITKLSQSPVNQIQKGY